MQISKDPQTLLLLLLLVHKLFVQLIITLLEIAVTPTISFFPCLLQAFNPASIPLHLILAKVESNHLAGRHRKFLNKNPEVAPLKYTSSCNVAKMHCEDITFTAVLTPLLRLPQALLQHLLTLTVARLFFTTTGLSRILYGQSIRNN